MHYLTKRIAIMSCALALSLGSAGEVAASPILGPSSVVFTGSSGTFGARATFSLESGHLKLVLENTTSLTAFTPADVLTGVFFNISGRPELEPLSARSPGGVLNGSGCDPTACSALTTNVGGEWGYRYSANGFTSPVGSAASYGIAAAGFSSMTPNFGVGGTTLFGNTQLRSVLSLSGVDFGIVGANYQYGSSNGGARVPLLPTSATFNWSGLPDDFMLTNIASVTFAYGSAPDSLLAGLGVAEPSSMALMGAGLLLTALVARRRAARTAS